VDDFRLTPRRLRQAFEDEAGGVGHTFQHRARQFRGTRGGGEAGEGAAGLRVPQGGALAIEMRQEQRYVPFISFGRKR
jgi:hypothetical protein